MANRMSMYSNGSAPIMAARTTAQQSSQVSTTTLLNALHNTYTSGRTYALDASTSLVVNTWLSAVESGNGEATVDDEQARRAWEHARRRAEDACIVLGSLHQSTPSVFLPFIHALPLAVPSSFYTAVSVLKAFTCHVTPFNASYARYSSVAASFTLNLAGTITGASLALSTSGINTKDGLLNIPAEAGYRAFDVFYYLLTTASTPAEREFLGLKHPSAYSLLSKSGEYNPPSYLPAADDAAAAEDFRNSLKSIGIKGSAHRNLLSVLAGLLKLGDTLGFLIDAEDLDEVCEDVAGLLGVDPEVIATKCSTDDREILVSGLYECLVDWILSKANEAIRAEILNPGRDNSSSRDGMHTPESGEDPGDTVSITVVEIPEQELGKAVALRGIFDDTIGINSEMKDDGIEVVPAGTSVLKEMTNAVNEAAADLGIAGGPIARDRDHEQDRREAVLDKVGLEAEDDGFLRSIIYPAEGEGVGLGKHGRFDLAATLGSSRVWYHLSLHPTDDPQAKLASLPTTTSAWSAGTVSRQLRAWRLPEWANRRNRNLDYTADFDIDEFAARYSRLGCQEGRDGVENWTIERGWSNGEAVVGHERVWIREGAWWEAESMLDLKVEFTESPFDMAQGMAPPYGAVANNSGFFPPVDEDANPFASRDNLVSRQASYADMDKGAAVAARSIAPTVPRTMNTRLGDYGLGAKGDDRRDYDGEYEGRLDAEMGDPTHVESKKMDFSRRIWVAFVWLLTFWIPSFVLRYVGRMKRPDVRMAWREKLVLVFLIFLLNGIVVFYIVEFGQLLCPNFDKAWNPDQVATHQGDSDFYVSVRGRVYDVSNFWQTPHSTVPGLLTDKSTMQPFAGLNLDNIFPPPLYLACSELVTDRTVQLVANNTPTNPSAIHVSGSNSQYKSSDLHQDDWYTSIFLPKITNYYKGDLVWDPGNITTQGKEDSRMWVILHGNIYDFTDYFNTLTMKDPVNNLPHYQFLPPDVTQLIQSSPGQDISAQWGKSGNFSKALPCMNNVFYVGITDFRESARCQVNNYILLAFTIILCLVILVKFLSALQFGSRRRPAPQDKFVICQVPAYTEGEDQLRKGLDSLTALEYDNKRKLICVICDGMIVGGGNDRPTPKIVLDILGVDPKIDPPALPFKSVGQGSDQLNYGKVYSGLYEFEGSVVPYVVIVKVGKESEQTKSKPGNRGKRDSQILLMSFLNRVHHRSPMSPLELEMFHQINNIIGVDPELYEYLFMVDADTSVRADSLNRLVANCAHDAKIAGICGETSLENEERSWWTMIQVYEYYISHHLAKAFESLFGSVTCLPGCFCMYRLRTADKGRPLIINDKIIAEYSDGDVDTLHKKNLFSLGEDRYLTTLMTKHFPNMSYKFVPDAYAATAAPESWGVLLSQRRRWINSTIHNLAELVFLKDLCGFCCFSMRFVVFIDLFGTLILPATCVYLGYLIYKVATHQGQFPLISIVMIAAVYGLQALIFLLKRQWQHIGWMIIYIIAFPIYSFVLPIYSFWKQDDFSWGTTRIVIGEKGNNKIIQMEDAGFDPRSIPLQRWDDYAGQNSLPGRRGGGGGGGGAGFIGAESSAEKLYDPPMYSDAGAYEMDDFRSQYSSARPASTVLTGFGASGGLAHQSYMVPQSPATPGPFMTRQSTAQSLARYTDAPQYHSRGQSMVLDQQLQHPYRDSVGGGVTSALSSPQQRQSTDNLMRFSTPPLHPSQSQPRLSRSPLGHNNNNNSRPDSTIDFRGSMSGSNLLGSGAGGNGPDEAAITDAIRACLAEVDLDSVTKKQVRALVEQRLQCEVPAGEKRAFLDRGIDAELANM